MLVGKDHDFQGKIRGGVKLHAATCKFAKYSYVILLCLMPFFYATLTVNDLADPNQKESGEGRSVKSSVASQISNLKTKVGVAPQQIISKIPNALRNKTHNKNETMDAIVEVREKYTYA